MKRHSGQRKAMQKEKDRDMRVPGRGPSGDTKEEEELCIARGAQEQPSQVSPSIRSQRWLKPPSKDQKPWKQRQPRKTKLKEQTDPSQRTIKIARRRKPGGEEGRLGGIEDDSQEGGEWT